MKYLVNIVGAILIIMALMFVFFVYQHHGTSRPIAPHYEATDFRKEELELRKTINAVEQELQKTIQAADKKLGYPTSTPLDF